MLSRHFNSTVNSVNNFLDFISSLTLNPDLALVLGLYLDFFLQVFA